MPSITKKPLHLAQSLDELKKKAEKKYQLMNNINKDITRIIDLSEKLYDKGNLELRQGDSESAYLFFHSFSGLLNYIHNGEDRQKFMKVVGTKALTVCKLMEELTLELSERYAEKQSNYESRKAKFFNNKEPIPGTSVKVEPVDDMEIDEGHYKCISSKELVELVESLSEISKILIIDIRPTNEFSDSSIVANKMTVTGVINIINIPKNIIKPGLTCPELCKRISFGINLDGLERRRSMDHVIIIDNKTYEFEKGCESYILADAIWKWDASADRIKNKPLLLKGGFRDFSIVYPMYVTKPISIDDVEPMDDYEMPKPMEFYNFLDKEKPKADNIQLNNNKPPDGMSSSHVPVKPLSNNQIINNNSQIRSVKIPGTAIPIIPDRSSKPSLDKVNQFGPRFNSETNSNDSDQIRLRSNLPPKPPHLLSSLNGNNKVDSVDTMNNDGDDKKMDEDDDLVAGHFDDNDIQMNISPTNFNNNNVSDEDMSDYENNHDSDGDINESAMSSHSISKPLEMNKNNKNSHHNQAFSSSLSRSLSSPNIAQFEQKPSFPNEISGSFMNNSPKSQIPSVDRSAKPLPYFNNNRDKKIRDFSPQFSSCARITGLRNLGNTCFMNSILQCLKNTREFYDFLVSGNWKIQNSKFGSNGQLTIELSELFKQMHHPSNCKHISPKDFKNAVNDHIPDFVDYKQQDAHEFLVRLLDRIHEDLNRAKPNADIYDPLIKDPNYYDKLSMKDAVNNFFNLHVKRNSSIITDLFEGLIVSTLTCLFCKSTSKALEAFTCLTLPIPENTTRTTLENCISLFLRGERLTNEVAWQCQKCKQKRDAEKCTYIWKLPKILIIHLKRFSYDGMWRQKINTFVDFKIDNFSIQSHGIGENRTYSLYGVVNHFGSLEGGHYVAYSRNKELGIDWNKYDDQDVTQMSESGVVTQHAYVLFYKSY